MKKLVSLAISMLLSLSFALGACTPAPIATNTPSPRRAATTGPAATITIGIALPGEPSARWKSDGESMVKAFEALGYNADLQFSDNDIPGQKAQIEKMITDGAKALVIAAIDGGSLVDVLQKAHEAGVFVIAYDTQITRTANVDFYVTFDGYGAGRMQGLQIEQALGIKDGKGPFNIELFSGSPDDANAFLYYDGAMSVLKAYIDSGTLVVQSGQTGMENVNTLRWDPTAAQGRMDKLLSQYYADKRVDAILSPHDALSIAILTSLKGVGYCTTNQPCPVVTGQDATIASIKSMLAGEQMFSIFKDTRELAKQAARLVDAVLQGKEIPTNDNKTYNNGVKIVPSLLLTPASVDITNYKQLLIDSGYISADQLK